MRSNFSTPRLRLDLLTEDDHAFILELLNTKGWIEFIGDRQVHSDEDAIAYTRRILNTPALYYWVVRLQHDSIPIGIISFLKRSYLDHFDIGFAFLPGYSGQGYALEAAGKVLDHLRLDQQYSPVLATTIPHNTSSIKLLHKLGLRFEKELYVGNETLHVYSTGIK